MTAEATPSPAQPPHQSDKFASRIGFILSAAGSAIGLGNLWRFPYMASEGGGAAFVLIYILCVLSLGLPVMMAEFAIGQAAKKGAVDAFQSLCPKTKWHWIGKMGVVTGFAILAFYSPVAGWALGYVFKSLAGTFSSGPMSASQSGQIFQTFVSNPLWALIAAVAIVLFSALIVYKGIGKGIERASLILMPLFFILLLGLGIHSLTLPGAADGLSFMFRPDPSKLTLKVIMSALGQSFFSLSIGMGVMITYSAYLDKKDRGLAPLALSSVCLDTGVALLAGIIIFPAIFTAGAMPSGGPGLAFVTFPTIFSNMALGSALAVAFYALFVIAALTSTISIFELIASDLVGRLNWTRHKSVIFITIITLLFTIPCALSFGASPFFTQFFGVPDGFFGLLNVLFGNITMVVGGFFICLFVGWKWGVPHALNALGVCPNSLLAKLLTVAFKWVCPLAIASVMTFMAVTRDFF